MKKRLLSTLLMLALFLCTLAPMAMAAEEPSGDPIYFAWVGPLTGDSKQYGDTEKVAVEIAMEDINGAGGILGRPLAVDFYDDKNDNTEAVTLANLIVGEGKYTAVIGNFSSGPSMASAPIYEEAGLIMYSPTASHADFTSLGDYMFRNTPTQAIETAAYAEYAYNELGARSVGILAVNDDWGVNITKIFTETFESMGGTITASETYLPGQTKDFTPMISKIKESNPDLFFPIAYYAESAQIMIQADTLDYHPLTMVSSSSLKQELIDLGGDKVEGVYLMNAYTPDIDTDEFKRVIGEYTTRTGKEGDAFVMQTYDVVSQLAAAIEEAGSDDIAAIRDVLANMKDYPAIAGPYSMNEMGDALRQLQPIRVENGEFINQNSK